jgi:hypothetical protein
MATFEQRKIILRNLIELLELPDSAYQKAEERYKDIGAWLGREESLCAKNNPHIFPQGSFRLGTAIRPLNEEETYDLDLACNLREGITKKTHTQQELKKLVGKEIESYRVARGINKPIEEKHRCWRLEYSDKLSFYMDIVPCIPIDNIRKQHIYKLLEVHGESLDIAEIVSKLTVSITDDRHPNYRRICDDWNISNPEGYALWFESRMNQEKKILFEKAQVDNIPLYKRKSPLQRSIQLLKRHRDQMFREDQDVKPISIIITTLAARAYQGEVDIVTALSNILNSMEYYVNRQNPRVPNPVNPNEDFADRWAMPQYKHLNLEGNFWSWLKQAQTDFELIIEGKDINFILEQAKQKFAVRINAKELGDKLGLINNTNKTVLKTHVITEPAKPWFWRNK